ncbi:hypothetical protein MBLNU459_g3258t1 [Dothideomycetes sp. NU459]
MDDGGPAAFGVPPPLDRRPDHNKRGRSHGEMERGFSMESAYARSESPLFVAQDAHSRDSSPPRRPRNRHPQRPQHHHQHQHHHHHHHHHHQHRLALPPRPPRAPLHYPGDGLDFRRSISNMDDRSTNFIDLTDDDETSTPSSATPQPEPAASSSRTQRLPRYDRQIIDLSADSSPAHTAPPPHPHLLPNQHNPAQESRGEPTFPRGTIPSPEVQFLSERPLFGNQDASNRPVYRHGHASHTPQPPHREPEAAPRWSAVDLTQDLDDDVVHVRTEGRAGVNMLRPGGIQDAADMGIGRLAARLFAAHPGRPARAARRQGPRLFQTFAIGGQQQDPPWMLEDDDSTIYFPPHILRRQGGAMPGFMNYETVAFELGGPEMHARPPTPKYEAPPPVPEPFTRSPAEGESHACPNCGDELAVGATDQKKQVWIVKGCGHVYCGECMLNRKKQRRNIKGKAKVGSGPETFSICQVDDCTVRVSHPRDVMQIFL